MSDSLALRRSAEGPPATAPGMGVLWACCWVMMFNTFSMPGRESPSSVDSLDAIGLAKVGLRGLVVVALGVALARSWRNGRRPSVLRRLLPWAVYAAWAFASVAWSPLATVSLGQAGGLLGLVLLAVVTALRTRGPADTSATLSHLALGLLAAGALIVAVHWIAPGISGLDRTASIEGSSGLVHPTMAGSTASLGILVVVAARLVWGWRWTRAMLIPSLVVHGVLLIQAGSRMALGATALALLLTVVLLGRREVVAAAVLAGSLLLAAYLAADPGLKQAERAWAAAADYARRGETDEQMASLNGRTLLWEAIWTEYLKSPLIGHGYYACAPAGEIDVWGGPANRTAHNVFLQVLMSTGIVGLLIFLWALWRSVVQTARGLRADDDGRRLAGFLVVLLVWFGAWGQLDSTFMGGVQPEAAVFFAALGLAVGQSLRGGPPRASAGEVDR